MPIRDLVLALGLAAVAGGAAAADTVYLRNGGVLHSERVEVRDDRVVLQQYGGRVELPLATVERIERNERGGPAPEAQRGSPPEVARDLRLDATERSDPPAGPEVGGAAAAEPDAGLDRSRPEYWRQRLAWIRDHIARIETELARYPEYRRSEDFYILNGQILWTQQQRRAIEARLEGWRQRERGLFTEARRAGVPPGWLRRDRGRE